MYRRIILFNFFFFNDTATTEIYTLSLHDALPILVTFFDGQHKRGWVPGVRCWVLENLSPIPDTQDRKSTRLNSSHVRISYAVFCLKKKKKRYMRFKKYNRDIS